jgi:hypothetical protein
MRFFERSELWPHKKGLFLYHHKEGSWDVAKALVHYARSLPNRDAVTKNSVPKNDKD